jgi:hypothetical protein
MTNLYINEEPSALSGPWWFNDTAVSATEESEPQEALFRIEFERAEHLELHLAAANYYQFWLNGEWMGYGPAQAPHGKLSVDTCALPWKLVAEVTPDHKFEFYFAASVNDNDQGERKFQLNFPSSFNFGNKDSFQQVLLR